MRRHFENGSLFCDCRMIQRISSEAGELVDEQAAIVYQMQGHVRSTFFECFLDFAGRSISISWQ